LQLDNPPVVQVGIDFRFDPDPEKQSWDLPVAMPFVERFRESLPCVEVVRAEEIRIEKRSPQGLPERLSGKIRLDRVSAHDEAERHWLEVGDDRMGYRLLRGAKEYPGFDAVLEKALSVLGEYIEHFRPTAVRRTLLSYLDIVTIPRAAREGIELDDYFRLGLKLPEDPFGPLGAFVIQFVLPPKPGFDELNMVFATEPVTDDNDLRFSMRWQSRCDGIDSLDAADLRCRLNSAHEHLVKCFFACFTVKGLELFGSTGSE